MRVDGGDANFLRRSYSAREFGERNAIRCIVLSPPLIYKLLRVWIDIGRPTYTETTIR